MPFLILLAALFVTSPGFAQTAITKDAANAYNENCLIQETPLMSDKAKELMCSCTAAQMMKNMFVEDIIAMRSDGPEARPAVNKMLLNVYAPCIEFPAYDYHFYTCLENPDTKKLSGNPRELCTCLASEVADYLDKNSAQVFGDILARNPQVYDPMAALTEDRSFKEFAQARLLACVAGR